MDTNYFVCTLGEAALFDDGDPPYKNINEFVQLQAKRVGNKPAVGFYSRSSSPNESWRTHVLSFSDVHRGSLAVADILSRSSKQGLFHSKTVALLCPSSADFLFTWLALMRLGHSVLLIATQLQPSAIAQLCTQCEVSCLLHDGNYVKLARATGELKAEEKEKEFWIIDVGSVMGEGVFQTISQSSNKEPQMPSLDETDVAYLHHTSGTSSGMPKPIPQSHRAALGVLPRLDGSATATFTTTPLYHGGIADLFRAWTSDALIWLFPGKDLPITAANVVRCLDQYEQQAQKYGIPRVAYFSSVPYVLEMMRGSDRGLQCLQKMDIVGVGGAALPAEVGDDLVQHSINLVSRFGSAECGFLLSSHREYNQDKDWQHLRQNPAVKSLKFERQEDGTAELIVLSGWPHMAKSNRSGGSYATADLFMPHQHTRNAWKYHSRADSQLTLITGKKFDPAPLESDIAASQHLADALVFGNGKPYPGVLLFRSSESAKLSDAELLNLTWSAIDKLNADSQSHTRISKSMAVPMPYTDEPLEKSSKGTVLRASAEKKFAVVIEEAYSSGTNGELKEIPDEEVPHFISETVGMAAPGRAPPDEETDLFAHGLDSVACMQLRGHIRRLLPDSESGLPLSIVEDCGTVRRLSEYVLQRRHGETMTKGDDEIEIMHKLAQQYSQFDKSVKLTNGDAVNGSTAEKLGDVLLLTGATGALGSHILHQYRSLPSISKIYCLVRGADLHAARERVSRALSQRGLPNLANENADNDKIEVVQSRLDDAKLGLGGGLYQQISREATVILHLAWAVNFRMRLKSFEKDHIAGVRNLINLALSSPHTSPPIFAFCSSVASCSALSPSSVVEERILENPNAASPLGYSRSKWVTEQICKSAALSTALRGRVAVFRVGQLSGDTEKGVWNAQEAWPMLLASSKVTGALPELDDEALDWLPVDVAAKSFLEAIGSMQDEAARQQRDYDLEVFHVLNKNRTPKWTDMLGWLKEIEEFEILNPGDWIARLEELQKKDPDIPAMKLLGHWKEAYGNQGKRSSRSPRFAIEQTVKAAPVLRNVSAVDKEYFYKIWQWIKQQ